MRNTNIVKLRLSNQRLSSSAFKNPAEVVRWLGAVQAQDYGASKWALALRLRNSTDTAIEDAFNNGEILRTHVMRPTWHFVTPEDIRWLLDLTSPRVNVACRQYYRRLELDEPFFRRAHKVIKKTLKDERNLTRTELRSRLVQEGIEPGDSVRMGFILHRGELDGLLCSGPRRGKQFTYALLDQRVPETKKIGRDEALAMLTLRYFKSHGPATVHDFAWWSGLMLSDVRAGLEMVSKKLDRTNNESHEYWFASTKVDALPEAILLPAFDEYLVGYTDRRAAIDPVVKVKGLSNSVLGSVVLQQGLIKGEWNKKMDRRETVIEVKSYKRLDALFRRALDNAVAAYGEFVGLPARMRLR